MEKLLWKIKISFLWTGREGQNNTRRVKAIFNEYDIWAIAI
jgi:hypothetical protein